MSFYESGDAVAQYLLFHYGTPEQICPLLPEARAASKARDVARLDRINATSGRRVPRGAADGRRQ